jgi:hypothetical protein
MSCVDRVRIQLQCCSSLAPHHLQPRPANSAPIEAGLARPCLEGAGAPDIWGTEIPGEHVGAQVQHNAARRLQLQVTAGPGQAAVLTVGQDAFSGLLAPIATRGRGGGRVVVSRRWRPSPTSHLFQHPGKQLVEVGHAAEQQGMRVRLLQHPCAPPGGLRMG